MVSQRETRTPGPESLDRRTFDARSPEGSQIQVSCSSEAQAQFEEFEVNLYTYTKVKGDGKGEENELLHQGSSRSEN
jgi:hypothetical protein